MPLVDRLSSVPDSEGMTTDEKRESDRQAALDEVVDNVAEARRILAERQREINNRTAIRRGSNRQKAFAR